MEPRIRPTRPLHLVHRTARRLLAASTLCLAAGLGHAATTPAGGNVLEAQGKVDAMANEAVDALKSKVAMVGVVGWAVFSGDPMTASLQRGLGEARSVEGQAWYMRMSKPACISAGYREVLVFRDEGAFQEFRQGKLQGKALQKLHTGVPQEEVVAFKFKPAADGGDVQLQPVDLSSCRFALQKDLQRALVAPPSSTKAMGGATHKSVQPGQYEAGVSPEKRNRPEAP